MARRRGRRPWTRRYGRQAAVVGGTVALVSVAILLIAASEDPPPAGSPVVLCVDSTVSTEDVRADYLEEIKTVARRTAAAGGTLYADDCGANATGTVSWPIHSRFVIDLGGELGEEQIESKLDALSDRLADLVEVVPTEDGTPLGEMLAVVASQCGEAGDGCRIYMFTDGKWADGQLRVVDGVTETESEDYIKAYESRLSGLDGVTVNFIGVGYGTEGLGELRLGEAEEVAEALVESRGGVMGSWAKRLP